MDNIRNDNAHIKVKIGIYWVTGKDFTGLLWIKGSRRYFAIDKWEKKQTHNGWYRNGCSQSLLPNISYTSLVKETQGQPVVEGNIFSKLERKLDAFKSIGSSGIWPRVLKEMTGTLPTTSGKKWLLEEISNDLEKVTICPSLRKTKIQETMDTSALPAAPQTHRGQKAIRNGQCGQPKINCGCSAQPRCLLEWNGCLCG